MSQIERPPKKILLVEDEPILSRIIKRFLGTKGFEIDIHDNGLSARDAASSRQYDLCISDIRLPGMSGIQLYQHLQTNNEPLSKRFIFVTGDTMNIDVQVYLNSSGKPFFLKPFNMDELALAASNILN